MHNSGQNVKNLETFGYYKKQLLYIEYFIFIIQIAWNQIYGKSWFLSSNIFKTNRQIYKKSYTYKKKRIQ